MEVTRVGVSSVGKIVGIIYAAIGVITGLAIFGVSLLEPLMGGPQAGGGFPSWAFGMGAVILAPVIYGIMGFLAGVFSAWVCNLAAGTVGGIRLDLAERAGPQVRSVVRGPGRVGCHSRTGSSRTTGIGSPPRWSNAT